MGKLKNLWKALAAGGAGVAALAAYNASIGRKSADPDENQIGGTPALLESGEGRIYYRASGDPSRPPILFVHPIMSGASAFTWRKNFGPLSEEFRVYAPDLLGFGFSDKPAHAPYSAKLYADLLTDFITRVAMRPVTLVAGSLSGAFAVHVARLHPELVRSLVLVSPTGTDPTRSRAGMTGAAFYGLLHSPVLGTSFYNAMVSERSVEDFIRKQLYFDKRLVTEQLVSHYYAMSHQNGAQYAIVAFFSGYLNTDIREAFSELEIPVTLVWGREDVINPYTNSAGFLSLNERVRLEVIDRCRQLPNEEHHETFNRIVRESAALRPSAVTAKLLSRASGG